MNTSETIKTSSDRTLKVARMLFILASLNLFVVPAILHVTFSIAGGGHGPVLPFFLALTYAILAYILTIFGVASGFANSAKSHDRPGWLYLFASYLLSPVIYGFATWVAFSILSGGYE